MSGASTRRTDLEKVEGMGARRNGDGEEAASVDAGGRASCAEVHTSGISHLALAAHYKQGSRAHDHLMKFASRPPNGVAHVLVRFFVSVDDADRCCCQTRRYCMKRKRPCLQVRPTAMISRALTFVAR
jgi:hypothetical protein